VKRLGALVAVLLVGVAVTLATPGRAGARRAPAGRVTLDGQPAWSSLGDDVQLQLAVRADPSAALEIHVVVHAAISSRIAFERTLSGDRLGSTVTSFDRPMAALPVVGPDRILILNLQDPAAPRDPNRIRLSVPGPAGVFPLEIQLRDSASGDVLSSFVTHLVAVPRAAAGAPVSPTRLQVAWLWRVAAPPSITPAGDPAPAFAAALAPGGRLGRLTQSLAQTGGVPVTLVPNPETVAGARALTGNADAADFVRTLRAAAATSSILAGPYTTVEGPALLRAGLGDTLAAQLGLGRGVLERDLDAAVDHTIAPPQPLDATMLGRLRNDAGTTRLVVDPGALADAEPADQFTPARPFRLDSAAGSFDALEVNRTTSDLLVRRGSDALRAQQVIAGLTVIALEQPNRARSIVMDTPVLWNPSPARVGAVLAGLRDNPILTGASVADIFDSVQAATVGGRPYVRDLGAAPSGTAPIGRAEYRAGRTRVEALASMVGDADPRVVKARHELDVTPASGIRGTGPATSRARLATVDAVVSGVAGKILAPPSRTFRLTSRRASVPLSLENSTDQKVKVRIRLTSQKLEFPEGAERLVDLPPGNTTTQFDVESRASGTFPVLVTVTSPDGGLALQKSRYTIRSAFVSGVGVFLTVGAGLFLAVWWLTHWRRSRRARTPALAS
jgi:hypothetical protein